MLILCSVQNFGYYGVMIWLPSYLSSRFGYTLTRSALWTSVTMIGMGFGIWLFGHLADRFGRRPTCSCTRPALAMVLVYSQLTDPTALLIGGAVMGLFVNGMLGGYGALLSEFYPTEARATAENVLFNLGRGVGGFGPFVVGALAATYSFDGGDRAARHHLPGGHRRDRVSDTGTQRPAPGIGVRAGQTRLLPPLREPNK